MPSPHSTIHSGFSRESSQAMDYSRAVIFSKNSFEYFGFTTISRVRYFERTCIFYNGFYKDGTVDQLYHNGFIYELENICESEYTTVEIGYLPY